MTPPADDPPTVAALAYAGTDVRPMLPTPWRTFALRTVIVCWAVPLALGVLVFVGALLSWSKTHGGVGIVWVRAGLADVALGVALTGVGGIAVTVFVASRWTATAGDRRRLIVMPAVAALLLLASNYVVAFWLVLLVA